MVKNEPIRLAGTDDEVISIARRAWRVVASDDQARGVLPALDRLGRDRQAFMHDLDGPTALTGASSRVVRSPRRMNEVGWQILLGIALLCAVASPAFAGPSTKRITIDAATAMPIILVATIAAIVLLAATIAAWFPVRHGSSGALTLTVIVLLIVVAVTIYRVVVGPVGGTTDFTSGGLALWQAGAILMAIELGVLAFLVRPRGEDVTPRGDEAVRRSARALRAEAARIAGIEVADGTRHVWEREVARLDALPAPARAQAREIGPVAWLAWAFYDGEIDVSTVSRK